MSQGCDGILSSLTEKLDKETIDKLPSTVKIISNFAVGFGNIDLKAAKRSGPKVTGKDTKLGPLKGQSLLKQTVGAGKNKKLNVTKEQLKASGMSLNGYANYMKKHGKRPPRMSMLRKK